MNTSAILFSLYFPWKIELLFMDVLLLLFNTYKFFRGLLKLVDLWIHFCTHYIIYWRLMKMIVRWVKLTNTSFWSGALVMWNDESYSRERGSFSLPRGPVRAIWILKTPYDRQGVLESWGLYGVSTGRGRPENARFYYEIFLTVRAAVLCCIVFIGNWKGNNF